MNRLKKSLFYGVIIALLIPFSALNGMAAEKVFEIGVLSPYTGTDGRSGTEFKAAFELALDKIQYKIGDYKLEPVWIDTQCDPPKATAAFVGAVEQHHIQATTNNWCSGVGIALLPLSEKYKVPHYFGPGGGSKIINETYKSDPKYAGYWLKGMPTPAAISEQYVDTLQDAIAKGYWKPANKKVAIFGEDTDWGRGEGEGFKKQFTAGGWEVVEEDYFPLTQTEFSTLMGKYKSLGVSVICGTDAATAGITSFVKQAHEAGLKAVIIADGLAWVGDWYKLTGSSSNYILDLEPSFVTPEAVAWAKEMKDKFGIAPGGWTAIAYDYDNFFLKILKRSYEKYGKIDNETLLKLNNEEVIPGKLTYGKKDGAIVMTELTYTPESVPDPVFGVKYWYLPVLQYLDGKGIVVFPEAWKTANFKAPE